LTDPQGTGTRFYNSSDLRTDRRRTAAAALDPALHAVLAGWAADELQSSIAQIEFLLRNALTWTGCLPANRSRLCRKAG